MKKIAASMALGLILASCTTTQIVVNQPKADIYLDNVKMGQGTVDVPRMGPPKRTQVTVRYQGETIGDMEIRRKFDVVTLFLGLYTYGVGLVVGWRYPELIVIPTDPIGEDDKPVTNPWMQPPRLWGSE